MTPEIPIYKQYLHQNEDTALPYPYGYLWRQGIAVSCGLYLYAKKMAKIFINEWPLISIAWGAIGVGETGFLYQIVDTKQEIYIETRFLRLGREIRLGLEKPGFFTRLSVQNERFT